MADFFTRLIDRASGAAPVVPPRTPSIYAPGSTAPALADPVELAGQSAVDPADVRHEAAPISRSASPAVAAERSEPREAATLLPAIESDDAHAVATHASDDPSAPIGRRDEQGGPAMRHGSAPDAARSIDPIPTIAAARAGHETLMPSPVPASTRSGDATERSGIASPRGNDIESLSDRRRAAELPAPHADDATSRDEGSADRPLMAERSARETARAKDMSVTAGDAALTDLADGGDMTPRTARRDEAGRGDSLLMPAARAGRTAANAVTPVPSGAERRSAEPAPQPEPTVIQVSIGRIDVRAIAPQPPATPRPRASSAPAMSLDEYLAKSNGGKR